jgi:hypothetical protein
MCMWVFTSTILFGKKILLTDMPPTMRYLSEWVYVRLYFNAVFWKMILLYDKVTFLLLKCQSMDIFQKLLDPGTNFSLHPNFNFFSSQHLSTLPSPCGQAQAAWSVSVGGGTRRLAARVVGHALSISNSVLSSCYVCSCLAYPESLPSFGRLQTHRHADTDNVVGPRELKLPPC